MKNDFNNYATELDQEVAKLLTLGQYIEKIKTSWKVERKSFNATDMCLGFTTKLKEILNYLGAKDIRKEHWHGHMARIQFNPVGSKYFRLGSFGEIYEIPVDKNLEGVIAIGFDEDLQYEDEHKPELVSFYDHYDLDLPSEGEFELWTPSEWRKALNEFFNYPLLNAK